MATKSRKPDHFALAGAKGLALRQGQFQHRVRRGGAATRCGLMRDRTAHRLHQTGMIKAACATFGNDLAVFHHHDPAGGFENFVQHVGNQDHCTTRRHKSPHMRQKLRSKARVQ